MSSRSAPSGADFDLDEDLFDFQAVADAGRAEGDDEDLEQVFAQFEKEEAEREADQAKELAASAQNEAVASLASPEPPPAIPRQARTPAPRPLAAPSAAELATHRRASTPETLLEEPVASSAAAPERAASVPRAPAAGPLATPGWRSAAWILIAVTSINALVALVALRSTGELRRSVETVGSQVSQTASELLREGVRAAADGRSAASLAASEGAPNAESHPTFELAREDIQRGEFARARRRLYALLAIVDRLEPDVREEIEARANFLLAQALHIESVQRWEVEQ